MGFVNVGPLELLVIGIIALIVLGPKRLPEAARSMGKGLREFRESLSAASVDDRRDDDDDYQNEAESSEPSSSSMGRV